MYFNCRFFFHLKKRSNLYLFLSLLALNSFSLFNCAHFSNDNHFAEIKALENISCLMSDDRIICPSLHDLAFFSRKAFHQNVHFSEIFLREKRKDENRSLYCQKRLYNFHSLYQIRCMKRREIGARRNPVIIYHHSVSKVMESHDVTPL